MQRKILNVYLYRDISVEDQMCYKMRFIEMQSMENFPHDLDNVIMDLYSGMEAPFAACLSDELDKYKDHPGLPLIGRIEVKNGGLFKKICDSYTREVFHNGQSYIYQDIDLLLSASDPFERAHRGDKKDMFCILGALDNAIMAFRNNAVKDGYEVSTNLCLEKPDFNEHLDIIENAFANTSDSQQSFSLQIANWLANDARTREADLPRFRYSHGLSAMGHLYEVIRNKASGVSFGDSILNNWYLDNNLEPAADKPNPARLFSGNIGSAIKPLRDNDLLTDVKTMQI